MELVGVAQPLARGGRRQAAMGRVEPDMVVVLAPGGEQPAGMAQAIEDLLVQGLVAQSADEAFDEGVLCGLPGAM